ncbi:transporter substrate-binding domain-containing protein [Candidatus Entotheonella palauensis]|uniref:transporter substrate-binding domain-containing protein n=1 Tax=Candidatus Entotheonella palauensis TaxID=93172 RepID=UPI000B7CD487|nr:transporter substrate-binding domain-containing protein [Candidatus Entotheonella palauensis]
MNLLKPRFAIGLYDRRITENGPYFRLCLMVLTTWVAMSLTSHSGVYAETQASPLLRVGSVPEHVLFKYENGIHSGFYVDLWDAVATELDLKYKWVVIDTFVELRTAVKNGELDVGASHISITAERERVMDYTHIVFNDGYQLYIPATDGGSQLNLFSILYESGFFSMAGTALLVLIALAHVVWLVEKRRPDSDFRPGYLHGIEDALWWSIVTITTVGYGDKTPKSRLGRLIAVGWMVMSLFVVSLVVGQVTSVMTIANLNSAIQNIGDLPGKSVGVVADTVFEDFLISLDIKPVRYKTSAQLFQALARGKLDVILSDVVNGLVLPKHIAPRVKKAGSPFKRDDVAWILPQGSLLREDINRALAMMYDSGRYNRLYDRWFRQ